MFSFWNSYLKKDKNLINDKLEFHQLKKVVDQLMLYEINQLDHDKMKVILNKILH